MQIVGYLQDGMARLKLGNETDRLQFGVALDAAIQNSIYFGNLEFTVGDLREAYQLGDAGKSFNRMIYERSATSPTATARFMSASPSTMPRSVVRSVTRAPVSTLSIRWSLMRSANSRRSSTRVAARQVLCRQDQFRCQRHRGHTFQAIFAMNAANPPAASLRAIIVGTAQHRRWRSDSVF